MNIFLRILMFTIIATSYAAEKILVITHVYNRPDFIRLHVKTLGAFLKEDYQYVVFNDAPHDDMCNQIENTCNELGVACVRVPQGMHTYLHDPSRRHADGIALTFKEYACKHEGIVMMLDSDAFLIKPFSAIKYMRGYDLIGCKQYRESGEKQIMYIAPVAVFMNMKKLPNKHELSFYPGFVEGIATDTGGHMHYYFKSNPAIQYRFYAATTLEALPQNKQELKGLGYDDRAIALVLSLDQDYKFEFQADGNILHFGAGGCNWPGFSEQYLARRTAILNDFIDTSIAYYNN